MTVELLYCGVLPPGLVQYCSQHSCVVEAYVFTVKIFQVLLFNANNQVLLVLIILFNIIHLFLHS